MSSKPSYKSKVQSKASPAKGGAGGPGPAYKAKVTKPAPSKKPANTVVEGDEEEKPKVRPTGFAIKSASELRKVQEEKFGALEDSKATAEAKESAFVERFKKACDEYYSVIMQEVQDALESNESAKTYVIVNSDALMDRFQGFSYSTMLYGFWKADKGHFDDGVFNKHEITPPFERAQEELEKLGYTLENVSDSARSLRPFFKVTW